MLTDGQLNELFHKSETLMSPVTDWLLADVCRRVKRAGQFTNTAEYEVWKLKTLGVKGSTISEELQTRLNMTQGELNKLIVDSSKNGYEMDLQRLTETAPAFKDNEYVQQLVQEESAACNDNFNNLTQTMGFVNPYGKTSPVTQAYDECCNYAFQKTATGATDLNTAVREATANLIKNGVQTVNYDSGVHSNVDVAVRRSILGGIGKLIKKISERNHKTLKANGWELSAHDASAPDHEPYQGLQYTDEEYQRLNANLKREIGTLNCKHIAFPIIYGKTKPVYTPEELEEMKRRNAEGIDYRGKHYTRYEATQQQRALERAIRAQKREIIAATTTGDEEKLTTAKAKIKELYSEYNKFSKAAGLAPQYNRFEIAEQIKAPLTSAEKQTLGTVL